MPRMEVASKNLLLLLTLEKAKIIHGSVLPLAEQWLTEITLHLAE